MYKINQVAHMLGVSTVDIHSRLIEQRDSLVQNIHKKSGITFIDDEGVKLIARLLEERMIHLDSQSDQRLNSEPSTADMDLTQLSSTDELVQGNLDSEMLVFTFREKISRLKAQINRIDQEILLKDEAIEHYLQDIEHHLK